MLEIFLVTHEKLKKTKNSFKIMNYLLYLTNSYRFDSTKLSIHIDHTMHYGVPWDSISLYMLYVYTQLDLIL